MIVRESTVPLYEQVKRHLLRGIADGSLAAGQRVPSERRLVDDLGVSRITVRKALGDLVHDGVLLAVPAKGFYVGPASEPHELHALRSFSEDARRHGQEPGARVLEARLAPADHPIAERLGVPVETELVSLRRLRLLDGVPLVIQHAWLPHRRVPGILDADLAATSLFALLRERYGMTLARGDTVIGARPANREERRLLGLPAGSPVLTVDQVTYDRGGAAVEVLRSVQDPVRLPLSISHGEGPPLRGAAGQVR